MAPLSNYSIKYTRAGVQVDTLVPIPPFLRRNLLARRLLNVHLDCYDCFTWVISSKTIFFAMYITGEGYT
jgi:hypothetical protein